MGLALAVGVEDDDTAIVSPRNVIGDGEEFSARRKAHVADPALGLIDQVSGRKLQVSTGGGARANHCERLPVWAPIRPQNILEHFARCAPREGDAGQSSPLRKGTEIYRM